MPVGLLIGVFALSEINSAAAAVHDGSTVKPVLIPQRPVFAA